MPYFVVTIAWPSRAVGNFSLPPSCKVTKWTTILNIAFDQLLYKHQYTLRRESNAPSV